ncbi:PREDICTED: sorbin and SH3 domain-containing protein 1 isoform X2 [Ceratosolen solmsi marchali]|uniref:Sorbin and SH3 domain-containing protein 1 isoform X2 n=1 Tax=Ceratosolen solmsi marchali TaxID=326594 RepID=A0AAJ6YLF8_9HYME|nr:PREDICTED: sorbin and SH3 domain-containing protein 1 isoform X2 [Ceratosolen solmsi marchali]
MLEKKMIAPTFKALSAKPGVWSPGSEPPKLPRQPSPEGNRDGKDESIPPVWTPSSAGPSPVAERKEFRPVPFESPILSRKKSAQQSAAKADTIPPPWQDENQPKEASQVPSQSIPSRIVNSYSAPSQGLNALSAGAPRLPRAQNPTITLLQKAREGHLPKGAAYLDDNDHFVSNKSDDKPLLSSVDSFYSLKKDYESEQETDNFPTQKVADPVFRKYEGIGPTTRGGIPIVLRSEVKENNQAKWYKQMYDSLHRAPKNDDYVTIRYKPHRGSRTGYSGTSSGYLSEPEPRSYSERSCTLDNRRHRQRNKENDFSTCTLPRPSGRIDGHYSPETYHLQPGRIEDYVPGNCSIQEKESKEWWDEVMDIFDGPFEQPNIHSPKSYMTHALKESGYESDSTLVFRRREDASPLSPLEQRIAYKTVQKGGDVPLHGLRKPAPERPKEYMNAPPPPPPKAQHYRGERQGKFSPISIN